MSKKLLMSILALTVAVGLVGAGTYAMWQDQVTSTGNKFTTGKLALLVNGSHNPIAPVDLNGMKPGDSHEFGFLAQNAGTIDGKLTVVGSFANTPPGTLADALVVTHVVVDGTEVLAGPVTLSSLGSLTIPPAPLAVGATRAITFTVGLPSTVTGHMTETVTGDLAFTLDQ
jgi:predicted ribosomally synthesized peptide with SipW-like signal peptide